MNKQKGFTIIELIVVIAIIAVLAAIVLVNVTKYIDKGKDASAKANLSTMLTNAITFYSTNYKFDNFQTADTYAANAACAAGTPAADAGFLAPCSGITNSGYEVKTTCDVAKCAATSTKWCALITEKAVANTYCVDSTGVKLEKASGTCVAGVCN